MPERLISMSVLLQRICLSKTQLYRKIKQGDFPRPIQIGERRVAFLESEVTEWIATRARSAKSCVHKSRVPQSSNSVRR
jgi:prophage regulatory protein